MDSYEQRRSELYRHVTHTAFRNDITYGPLTLNELHAHYILHITCLNVCKTSHEHKIRVYRTEGVHLHTLALQTGTHFLLTLETIVFLFYLLGATSKPFSSLSVRLAHAARLGFFLQKRAI